MNEGVSKGVNNAIAVVAVWLKKHDECVASG